VCKKYIQLVNGMQLTKKNILGIGVTIDAKEPILEYVYEYLVHSSHLPAGKGGFIEKSHTKKQKPLVIFTPNPEQVVYARYHPDFAHLLNQADVAIPDGVGLVIAQRLFRTQNSEPASPARFADSTRRAGRLNDQQKIQRIPGVEFMENLVALAAKEHIMIGCIGGRSGVAVKALERLQSKYPGLDGWAEDGPEIQLDTLVKIDQLDQYANEISQKIQSTHTGMVFVGLGAPKQEYFISRLSRAMSFRPPSRNPENKQWIPGQARDDKQPLILMSVGGSFDILSGLIPRAPQYIRLINLEWLYRLVREPWRWKRQVALVEFSFFILSQWVQKCVRKN
jgi:N-acetylglucosaminyldiphosphoundecaprenol N-acetyl-beta-D-mannosaminyltransferase